MHPLLSKVEATPHAGRYRIALVDEQGVELHAEMESKIMTATLSETLIQTSSVSGTAMPSRSDGL